MEGQPIPGGVGSTPSEPWASVPWVLIGTALVLELVGAYFARYGSYHRILAVQVVGFAIVTLAIAFLVLAFYIGLVRRKP